MFSNLILSTLLAASSHAAQNQNQSPQSTPEQIKAWVAKLQDDSPQVRDEATERLIEARVAAVDEVKKLATWSDPEVRTRALRILAEINRHKDVSLDKTGRIKVAIVRIEPGSFIMGSPKSKLHERQHKVTITKGFWMGVTKITQRQWETVMGSNPSYFKGSGNLPVGSVSWIDCQYFIMRANRECDFGGLIMDLPTEAEWEYACRAGTTTLFSFGDDEAKLGEYAWYRANSDHKPHPVGEKKPNPWGLFDMHGNMEEWCKDIFQAYKAEDVTDPWVVKDGSFTVIRGGYWTSDPRNLRSAARAMDSYTERGDSEGLRVVFRESRNTTILPGAEAKVDLPAVDPAKLAEFDGLMAKKQIASVVEKFAEYFYAACKRALSDDEPTARWAMEALQEGFATRWKEPMVSPWNRGVQGDPKERAETIGGLVQYFREQRPESQKK